MDDTRFGIILLENPFIPSEDVRRCVQIQALGGRRKPIGQILLEEGGISQQTLELVLSIQEGRRVSGRATPHDEQGDGEAEVPEFGELLDRARTRDATDVLLATERRPRARVCGRLVSLSQRRIDRCWMKDFLRAILDPAERELLALEHSVVTRLRGAHGDTCRLTVFQDSFGVAASLRLVPAQIPTLDELGHLGAVSSVLANRRGLLLVAGGPRSGKSTTVAAMVQTLAREGAGHIVVIDEFHEFNYEHGADGLVTRKRVSRESKALSAALRSAFREDPDVIVVGDLHGAESIELCMQLASTGHLVVAGMQASGSVECLRKLEEGVPDQVLANFRGNLASELRGVIYQDLVPSVDGTELVLAEGVILTTKAIRRAIADGRLDRLPILVSFETENECRSMDDRLMDLVEAGQIAIEEAFARARDRHRFLMTAG